MWLQVYGARVRSGKSSKSGNPVRSQTVAEELRQVGQTIALMGAQDPRFDRQGNITLPLQRQLRGYTKEDDPPTRKKPIPFEILTRLHKNILTDTHASPALKAIADMVCIAVFFLMRPGECREDQIAGVGVARMHR